jgi:AraC-type DNA-binding domain-containing proteins
VPTGERALFELVDDGGSVGRERALPDRLADGGHLLILQIEGRCVVQPDWQGLVIEAGDLLFAEAPVAARVQVFGCSRQLCMALPGPLTQHTVASRRLLRIGRIRGASGLGAALRSLLLAMRGIAGRLTAAEQRRLRAVVLDLALLSLTTGDADGDGRRCSDADVGSGGGASHALAGLQATIEQSLSDPGLSPARVAAAHGMSTRQLHRLFKRAGTSFSAFVRERRLDRCRGDLADPRLRAMPMTEIAFRWGFSDSAHFSRCFRAAFGCTARDFRAGRQATASIATPAQR